MYVRFPKLSDEALATLQRLRDQVQFTESESHRRRMGENGQQALSRYRYSRYFFWPHAIRSAFKAQFPSKQAGQAVVGWYLELDPEVGFLDRMTYWVGKRQSGTSIAYALHADQVIYINDEPVTVPKGEGIGFNLSEIHEIKPSDDGQLWACVMVLGAPERYQP